MVTYLAEFMALTRGHLACGADKGGRAGEGPRRGVVAVHGRQIGAEESTAELLRSILSILEKGSTSCATVDSNKATF